MSKFTLSWEDWPLEHLESVTTSSKVTADFKLDWQCMSKRKNTENDDEEFKAVFRLPYAGVEYTAGIHFENQLKNKSNFKCHVSLVGVKNAVGSFNMIISDVLEHKAKLNAKDLEGTYVRLDYVKFTFDVCNLQEDVESITGTCSITFEPSDHLVTFQELKSHIARAILCHKSEDNEDDEDFKIVCVDTNEKEVEIAFHKKRLSKISDVFKRMIDNTQTKESMENAIKIIDVNPETVQNFKEIFAGLLPIGGKAQLNVDLMMFGHKYNIPGLADLCADYLSDNLKHDNILEVIKAAYFMEKSSLFKKAVRFLMANLGTIEETPEWIDLEESHPTCFVKITEMMLFQRKLVDMSQF